MTLNNNIANQDQLAQRSNHSASKNVGPGAILNSGTFYII